MATLKVRLSKRAVDAAKVPATGEARLWDNELVGLCLRVYVSGRKVYAVKFRVGTRQRWATIGVHGQPWRGGAALTPEEARREAKIILGAAADGEDATNEKRERRAAVTVAQLIDRYLDEGPSTKPAKRASSWTANKGNLNHHVRPLLGDRVVKDLTRADIARMVKAITIGETAQPEVATKLRGRARVRGSAGIAGRVLAASSAMLSWGIEHGIGTENMAKGVRLPRRAASERFLSAEEATTMFAKLEELEDHGEVAKSLGAIIRLLLLTGARKTEIAALRWQEVDLPHRRLVLPPERTKAGGKTGERRIALSAAASAVLGDQPGREGWVFPSTRGQGHVSGVQKAWEKVRAAADLPGVRLHDLRHSFASFAVANGASLFLVGKALGHADTRTTERYAHLTDDPLIAVAESAGAIMMAHLGIKKY